ncbi:MAG TPA: hypothetical protein VNC18_17495 [Gemmatimonadaceae bacterium]|nr:hypothetical protein [Gemmatimonadaceae bacterium]
MTRLLAFAALTCAAFAWVPPGIDRAGLAALGFAFLALSIGRGLTIPFSVVPRPSAPAMLDPYGRIPPVTVPVKPPSGEQAEDADADLAELMRLSRGGEV